MREIPLTQGKVALVDDEDYEALSRHKWHASQMGFIWYAVRWSSRRLGPRRKLYLHRVVLGLQDPTTGENLVPEVEVDHADGDGLNNRRENLRRATHSQNQRNKRKIYGISQFRGVGWDERIGKWVARVCIDGRQKNLGRFDDEEEAARAYDRAALSEAGEFARLNFPAELDKKAS